MGWIVAGIMFLIVLLFAALYKKSLDELNHIFSLVVLILLDHSVYESQKNGLIAFIRDDPSIRASDLSSRAFTSTVQLANRLSKTSVLGAHAALWKVKKGNGEIVS